MGDWCQSLLVVVTVVGLFFLGPVHLEDLRALLAR